MDFGVLIRQLQQALGGKYFRSGPVTFTFVASTVSGTQTVDHGLEKVPSSVSVQQWTKSGVASGDCYVVDGSLNATSFQVVSVASASISTSITTTWFATG